MLPPNFNGPVWLLATAAGRLYITPEDVNEARESGADRISIWTDVLQAVESGRVEDASCTASCALKVP